MVHSTPTLARAHTHDRIILRLNEFKSTVCVQTLQKMKELLRRDIFKRDYLLFFSRAAAALSTLIITEKKTTKYAYIIIEVYSVQ